MFHYSHIALLCFICIRVCIVYLPNKETSYLIWVPIICGWFDPLQTLQYHHNPLLDSQTKTRLRRVVQKLPALSGLPCSTTITTSKCTFKLQLSFFSCKADHFRIFIHPMLPYASYILPAVAMAMALSLAPNPLAPLRLVPAPRPCWAPRPPLPLPSAWCAEAARPCGHAARRAHGAAARRLGEWRAPRGPWR